MTRHPKPLVLLGVLVAGLLAATLWSYTLLAASRASAATAIDDHDACQRLASSIESLQQGRLPQDFMDQPLNELVRRIEMSAQSSLIPTQSLVRIWPEPERRIGNTPYKQKPTQILLRNVTLKQLITFLYRLTADGLGLQIPSIRLTAPRDNEAGSLWTTEITATYLSYDPIPTSDYKK